MNLHDERDPREQDEPDPPLRCVVCGEEIPEEWDSAFYCSIACDVLDNGEEEEDA